MIMKVAGLVEATKRRTVQRMIVPLLLVLMTGCEAGEATSLDLVSETVPVPQGDSSNAELRIALTFDDVPFVARRFRDRCDAEEMLELNRKLLATIDTQNVPATALVVASRACGPEPDELLEQILGLWIADGHQIGNHTYSHRDFNTVGVDWYLEDVRKGSRVVDRVRPDGSTRWFRAPLLHMGDTPEKKQALDSFLDENEYRVAPVTIDNQEWVFAAVYEVALDAGDQDLAARVGEAFVEHIGTNLAYYEALSDEVFGRQIPQVLLLHSNLMNIDYLDELTAMLSDRGYELIPLSEAVADRAYSSKNDYVGPRGLSWLQRWAISGGIEPAPEPREPNWIAETFRAIE